MARWCWRTKKRRSLRKPLYRGRFAPSPTGSLHFGSLVAAVGSYLDAKYHHGTWLVRIEDLDTPRCIPGAADDILHMLEAFGLHWDENILYQSQRTATYEMALQKLKDSGATYPCCCSRKEITDSALHGIEGFVYPGTCRNGISRPPAEEESNSFRQDAWRIRTDLSPPLGEGGVVAFNDALQGHIVQHLEKEVGDFVVKRADGLFAYQLAVVIDDAAQNITHIVRGADLLASTPRQIYLQALLGITTPDYMHLPIVVNAQGEKLSKQTLATALSADSVITLLVAALDFLHQPLPVELRQDSVEEILGWAVRNWQPNTLKMSSDYQAT